MLLAHSYLLLGTCKQWLGGGAHARHEKGSRFKLQSLASPFKGSEVEGDVIDFGLVRTML